MTTCCKIFNIVNDVHQNQRSEPLEKTKPLDQENGHAKVTEATYLGGYKLKIRFDNGESKVVDLQPHLDGPIFEPLKDLGFFKSFYVNQDLDTIVWPNNADFAPDFLYEIGGKDSEQDTSIGARNSRG